MKIIVTDYIHENQEFEATELGGHGHTFEAHQLKFRSEEEVFERIRSADAIVVNMVPFPASLIERLDKCRLIIRHGIGYDNVDVAACTKKGIQFAYQPDYCQIEVAEHAAALVLACGRKVHWSRRTLEISAAAGQWDFSGLFPLYRMEGKTLGLLGVGRIGSLVARKLSAFGMKIIAHDPLQEPDRMQELGVESVDKETLFRESDFISIHTPLDASTRHIVNAQTLAWMKPTSYLINTARAGMIDTEALVDALKKGLIAGAALDVFEKEPPAPDHPLMALENVMLTPHIGWASEEAGWQIRRNIVNDLIAFGMGQDARHVVNKEMKKEINK